MDILYYLTLALFGAAGQLCRAFLGLKKAIEDKKPISLKRLICTTIGGAVSGAIIGVWTQDYRTAFFSGLASTDLVEGLLRMGKK